ncbi:MAG: major capsid protein [Gammaproteobacteria bacterium]
MSLAPYPINPELTAIALAYRNARLIADDVLPRVPVGTAQFKYWKYTLADGFTLPDTKVGRKSRPNEVEFSATEVTDSVVDYGLDDPVPQNDIDTAPPGRNPLDRATMGIMDLVLLDREQRAAALVFNASNYAAANKSTLSGTSQWSDPTSDPISAVLTALDAMVMRGNIMVLGRATYSKLIQHPKIVEAVYKTGADAGIVQRRQLADLFELEDVLVGEGWVNSAKKGQSVSLSRVWGKHCALIYRDSLADANRGTTFGFTAQFGSRVAGTIPDPNIGMRGGQRVRAGESLKELITANDLGYLFTNAVA